VVAFFGNFEQYMKVNKTLVAIPVMISLVMLLATSCGSKDQDERYSSYKFNATALDSLVDLKQALIDVVYRPDSSIREKRYYLGDSVKMVLTYNKQGALLNVTRHEDAIEVWTENYYPNGQRLSRFNMYTDPKTGESHYHGVYKSYYQTGWLKEIGEYRYDKPYWILSYTESGLSGDTVFYEYEEAPQEISTEPIEIP